MKYHFPHLSVLEKCVKGIDHSVLCIGPNKDLDMLGGGYQEISDIINGNLFTHIIEHCTRLKALHIYFSFLVSFTST